MRLPAYIFFFHSIYICLYVFIWMYKYVYMHIYIYIYIYTHTHTHTYSHVYVCPVGWGCRIHRLHFCRGLRPPPSMSS